MKMNKKYSGFTLVELLIVIAIIGILSMIAIPRFATVTDGANIGTLRANHRTLLSGVYMWSGNHAGQAPSTDDHLVEIMNFAGVVQNKPNGATYELDGLGLTSIYTKTNTAKDTFTIKTDLSGDVVTGDDPTDMTIEKGLGTLAQFELNATTEAGAGAGD